MGLISASAALHCGVEEDGTCGLVIEVFDDLNKVCADVVLLQWLHTKLHAKPCLLYTSDAADS